MENLVTKSAKKQKNQESNLLDFIPKSKMEVLNNNALNKIKGAKAKTIKIQTKIESE
jgi:hypothetical protein